MTEIRIRAATLTMQTQSSQERTVSSEAAAQGVIFIFEKKRSFTLGTEFHQTSCDYEEANLYR